MKTISGSVTPTMLASSCAHMPAQLTTVSARMTPLSVVTFQSRLYQVYVSCQYDVQNLKPCIPILERYIALTEANSKDVWAYRYLTSCYGFMENMVGKFRLGSEEEALKYKQLKNRNMLKATEIQYGVDSPEYKHIQEIVETDEKKTERLNDFK